MEKLTLEGLQAEMHDELSTAGTMVGKIASWTIVAVALGAVALYWNYHLGKKIEQKETKNG